MRRSLLVAVTIASASWADVPPPPNPRPASTACVGKGAGDPCEGGRCTPRQVRRPDFSTTPPTWGTEEVLVCEPLGAAARVTRGPAALLALLALLVLASASRLRQARQRSGAQLHRDAPGPHAH
jgi:hypothetical protein